MRRALVLLCVIPLLSCGSSSGSLQPGGAEIQDTTPDTETTTTLTETPTTSGSTDTRPATAPDALPFAGDLLASSVQPTVIGSELETWTGWASGTLKRTATTAIPSNSPALSFAPTTLGGVERTYTIIGNDLNGAPTEVNIVLRTLLVDSPAAADAFLDAFASLRGSGVVVRDTQNLPIADHSVGTCVPDDPANPKGAKSSEMAASAGNLVVWAVVTFPFNTCAVDAAALVAEAEMRAQLSAHPALLAD